MSVLHLDTGHVLAAGAFPGATVTVDALTGGSHLALGVPVGKVIAVPSGFLTLLEVPWDEQVLAAPVLFRVVDAEPRLSWVGTPAQLSTGDVLGNPRQPCLAFWSISGHVEVVRDQLSGTGTFTSTGPARGVLHLLAVPGRPLRHGQNLP